MRTCVVIPTYNESKEIAALIKEIKLQNLDCIIIDDGSSDNTYEIAEDNGATVLRNTTNQGKGASLRKGFKYALDCDYDAVITMDGDGQHLPQDIPFFLRLAKYSDSAIFIGNRMKNSRNMPWLRFFTNRFMSWILSCLAKQKVPDSQCGFRLIKKEVLKNLNLITSKFEIESEMLIRVARLGYKIESVPIKTVYKGQKSQINPFIDTLRFIKFIIKELWTMQY